jgi:hypothetical protein
MAFPTLTDLEFYKQQRLPAWAERLRANEPQRWAKDAVPMIDLVVNSHAGLRSTRGVIAAHNLLAILRSYRRRGVPLAPALRALAQNPQCVQDPHLRAAFARKWAAKLDGRSR